METDSISRRLEEEVAGAEHIEIVSLPVESLYETIMDFESYPKFVSGVKGIKIVERSPQGIVVAYDVEMMKRIQYSILSQTTFDREQGVAELTWSLKQSGLMKLNNGGERLAK